MNKSQIFILFLFLLTACQGSTFYHSYQPVPNAGWQRNDTLFYSFPTSLDTGYYDMQIGIRHLESYPYKDIWLEISHHLQDSTSFQKDTLHLFLADEWGNWYGNGIGGLLQYTEEQVLKIHLQEKDILSSFRIVHLMNDSLLKSVYDVGIQLRYP